MTDNPTSHSNPMRIGVVGTGYVGLTTGACLASLGHVVVCGDIDPRKVEVLNGGGVPIVEAGLEALVAESRAAGRLSFVVGSVAAAADADVVFLCVPTPQGEDGSADLTYIEAAAGQIAESLRPGAVVVNKSTVPVGSTRVVERALGRADVPVVSNPEFLREGTAVHDFLHPDRVVIGSADTAAAERVAALYAPLGAQVQITDPASAETIKYAANGFLAMKISFVNAVAAMCEAVGADVAAVVDGIGSDQRIGHAFLNPGPGWGGSCFPKDSRALVKIAEDHGYDFSMMRGVIDVNDEQRARMIDKIGRAAGRPDGTDLSGVTVGALGLTFKAGTDDLRESPALSIIDEIRSRGGAVRGFDPTTTSIAAGQVDDHRAERLAGIEVVDDPYTSVTDVDVVAVFTEWPEFAKLDLARIAAAAGPATTIVDTRNLLDPDEVRAAGLDYDGVGRR